MGVAGDADVRPGGRIGIGDNIDIGVYAWIHRAVRPYEIKVRFGGGQQSPHNVHQRYGRVDRVLCPGNNLDVQYDVNRFLWLVGYADVNGLTLMPKKGEHGSPFLYL